MFYPLILDCWHAGAGTAFHYDFLKLHWNCKEKSSHQLGDMKTISQRGMSLYLLGTQVDFLLLNQSTIGCSEKLTIHYVPFKNSYAWRWSHSYKSLKLLAVNCHQQQCENYCIYRQEIFSDKHIDSCLTFPVDAVPVFLLLFKQVKLKMLIGGLTMCHKTLYKVPKHKYVRLS